MSDRVDVVRSLRRALVGGPLAGWERVHLAREQLAGEALPVAVLEAGAKPQPDGAPGGDRDHSLPVTLTALPDAPVPAGVEPGDPAALAAITREARLAAERLAQRLDDFLADGPVSPPLLPSGLPAAGPQALPIWDFTSATATGSTRGGAEDPHDVMWIDEWQTTVTQEDAEASFVVTCQITVSWRTGSRDPDAAAPLVGALPGAYDGPQPPP